jgi:hypothetical protein
MAGITCNEQYLNYRFITVDGIGYENFMTWISFGVDGVGLKAAFPRRPKVCLTNWINKAAIKTIY